MKLQRNQTGFEVASLAAIVLILAVIGFTGYKVWQRHDASNNDAGTTAAAQHTTAAPATINSKTDLNTAAKSLDDASSQVNTDVNGDALDGDINDLL